VSELLCDMLCVSDIVLMNKNHLLILGQVNHYSFLFINSTVY